MIYLSIVSFRLLTEYHSFLFYMKKQNNTFMTLSFRLLTEYHSFLLEFYQKEVLYYRVSVSLRSIIHSYLLCTLNLSFSSLPFVSVSLRSIIHSYPMVKKVFCCNNFLECYRMIFLFLNFFCLFQLKASLTPLFLNIV